MKKVLKLVAKSTVGAKDGKECQCVKISFQYYKEGHPNDGKPVIIYRREEPKYIFDYEEWEYFDCLLPRREDIIFKGHLEEKNTFCEYVDYDVKPGRVYAYWVGKESFGKAITGPAPVKVRDRRVWWHFDEILEKTYALKCDFPSIDLKEVGKTVHGKPLIAIFAGNRENMIACTGAVHAGESGPEILLTAIREILTEKPESLEKCGIAILPVVNADMREVMVNGAPWYIRKNANGVDLNRNFDANWQTVDYSYGLISTDPNSPTYRGPYPNSEPEVQAVISFIELVKPRAVFSYHWLCSISSDKMLGASSAKDDKEYLDRLNKISLEYSTAFRGGMGAAPRLENETPLICSCGSLPNWLHARGVVCFDMEMSADLPTLATAKKDKSTPKMLKSVVSGHKAGLLKMTEYFA